tara:strand:- start:342 stop:1583 length:1242 start_codon:yes stop_codon:yes gene_type:complete
MNEEIKNEIKKAAEILGMTEEEGEKKFLDICEQNNIDIEQESLLARSLWRQYFSNAKMAQGRTQNNNTDSDDGFFKKAIGFFISLDDARDMMASQRERIVASYHRDSDLTFEQGQVAMFTTINESSYEGRMMVKGEEVVKIMTKLPNNHVEVDTGLYLVPLDNTEKYGTYVNKNFGKPLPKSEFRRSGVFIGEVNGQFGKYYFNYKGEHCQTFAPQTFELIHFICTVNSNDGSKIHGVTDKTSASLMLNSELALDSDIRLQENDVNVQDMLMEYSSGNFSTLIDLDRYHTEAINKAYNNRFVFTDGSVTSINMNPTKNGNRIINLDDLNTDFDFDSEGWSGTTCWIPSHIDIDFGIGSNVIVVGRTSQSRDTEGNLQPVTINVTGLYVTKRRGGSPQQIDFVDEEDDTDWFFS